MSSLLINQKIKSDRQDYFTSLSLTRRPTQKPFKPTNRQRHINQSNTRDASSLKPARSSLSSSSTIINSQHITTVQRRRRSNKPFYTSYLPIISLFILTTTLSFTTTQQQFPFNIFKRNRATTTPAASAHHSSSSPPPQQQQQNVHISVVAPLNQPSQLPSNVQWDEVLPHMAQRLQWTDPSFHLHIIDAASLLLDEQQHDAMMKKSDIVVALGLKDDVLADVLLKKINNSGDDNGIATFFAIDSHTALHRASKIKSKLISINNDNNNNKDTIFNTFLSFFSNKKSDEKEQQELIQATQLIDELYNRHTADDLLYCFLVLINSAVRPVDMITNSTKQANAGIKELSCMISNCGKEIFQCFSNPTCRAGLDCLNGCAFNDQVCSYRCIVSYESPQLQAFSLCILQKHNCLNLSKIEIPALPAPEPLLSFQGRPMTHDLAEDIFVGWLKGAKTSLSSTIHNAEEPFSWRVFAGKNAAYDHFPCQYQLFYPGKAKNTFWYQPVFKVITLDGQAVWRQRLYRVRKREKPGTFRLSVLDNGVTSLENWTILDCDDRLEWCVFSYNGAASAAGLSYTGAILTSKSGEWPTGESALNKIESALDRAGIKMWELSTVSHKGCGNEAPLMPYDVALLSY